jgi:hypothetical protein
MTGKQGLMLSEYDEMTHRWGRIWTAAALIVLLALPLLFCLIYGVMPDWDSFWQGAVAIVPMYWAIGLIEVFNYSPMLGAGGTYLAFITGNIANMKVVASQVTLKKAGVSASSEEGEVLSTIAVAVSSIVTTLILLVGLVLVIPIANLINADPLLKQVFDLSNGYVIPALFGALGVVFISKSWRLAVIPTLLIVALFVLVPKSFDIAGILIPVMSVLAVLIARLMYKKNKARM